MMDENFTEERLSNLENTMRQLDTSARVQAVTGLDANPDEGARALELSRATGLAPSVVYNDLGGTERAHRSSLLKDIFENNPHLGEYVRANPLGDVVSNDDYGNMDKFSRTVPDQSILDNLIHSTIKGVLNWETPVTAAFKGAIGGAAEGAKEGFNVPFPKEDVEAWDKANPVLKFMYGGKDLGRALMSGFMGALTGGMTGGIEGIGKNVGADETEIGQLQRDALTAFEESMGRVGDHAGPVGEAIGGKRLVDQFRQQQAFQDAAMANTAGINTGMKASVSWLKDGLEPPRGVSLELDRVRADINKRWVEALDENLAAAQEMVTRERSPEHAKAFIAQHYGTSRLGISGDAVVELYGDRVPTPDDGLLGWVPDLETQLEAARATGEDVHIPLVDWMTSVDPAVAKQLQPHIRVWPGGITEFEASEPSVPHNPVDSPIAQARAAHGLEPMFGPIGDRKLELKQRPEDPMAQGFHDYDFVDENGKVVGNLEILPDPEKKQLYVANINGLAGLYSNSFGPSLIRDLKRQLKALYPEYETITGHRVSGARYPTEESFGIQNATDHPVVKLGPIGWDEVGGKDDWMGFREIFERKFADQFSGENQPKQYAIVHTPEGDAMFTGVRWDMDTKQIAPRLEPLGQPRPLMEVLKEKYEAAGATKETPVGASANAIALVAERLGLSDLRTYYTDHPDSYFASNGGLYNPFDPAVLIRAQRNPASELKVAVHETAHAAFHHVINNNPEVFHTIKEMMDFVNKEFKDEIAAEGKAGRFYGMTDPHEFISEAFSRPDFQHVLAQIEVPKEFLERKGITFADGIKTVWDWFISTLQDAFGMEKTPENRTLLETVLKYGEQLEEKAGERQAPLDPANNVLGPMFGPKEDVTDQLSHIRATVAGLDQKTFERLQKILQTRHEEDVAAAMKRAEKNQKKTLTKEWKEASAEIRKQVDESIRQRPDVMADLMIGAGEIGGKKIRQRYPLRSEDLTPEQKLTIPRHYYAADGLPVDAVAGLFGYTSGDAMMADLAAYHADRGDLSPNEHLQKVISDETNRQMEALYGSLNDNIMREATDQALSETQLDLVGEEWQAAAMQASVAVVDKDVAKQAVLDRFGQMRVGNIDGSRLQAQMLKHYNDAVRDLINGDPATAVRRLQRRYEIGLMAVEAKKLAKEQKSFDRTAKQFAKREIPSAEPEYIPFIHDVLDRVGKSVRSNSQDRAKQIEGYGYTGLQHFAENKNNVELRVMPVWDQLFDPNWRKEIDDLTVDEFRALASTIKTMTFNARDERKIYRQGEAEDLANLKEALKQTVADSVGGEIRPAKKPRRLRQYYTSHLQMENIFNRWDQFDAKGPWNQYVMRDLVDGANQEDVWKKEFAGKIKDLGEPENLNRKVDNPIFKDQDTGEAIPFTRKNLITVMLNTGTGDGKRSNLRKLAEGYGLEPDEVMAWVHANATAKDWEWVRGMWDIFAEIKTRADTMYRSMSGGVSPENVPVYDIATPHGVVKGGYYPIIYHTEMEGTSRKLMGKDPLAEEGYVHALPSAGYTKSRTGYTAPVALDMDAIPGRIAGMLHDIAMRPSIVNASKVMFDHDIRSAIRKHYGDEYRDLLIPYLRGVANNAVESSKAQRALTQVNEFVRQNVISTLVGLNPGTVMKHGPSALVTSINEVGGANFLKAVLSLHRINDMTGESNWQFAMKNSLELQRRDRNWEETLYGAGSGVLTPGDKVSSWRAKIMQWSSKPVALSDMLSAVPTWLAEYTKQVEAGETHGDAVFSADRAVRRAHGSTAATNRTQIMREASPWLTSVYNFFSDIMNRQMETIWRAGEISGKVKSGDMGEAVKAMGPAIAGMFAYALWPAIVEHMVSGEAAEKDESWAKTAGKALTRTAASSWVGVRDFANWILYGHDPQFGLLGTTMKEVGNTFMDLGKDDPLGKKNRGRLIQDGAGTIGALTGMLPQQAGRSVRFVHDVETGQAHPKGPWSWLVGLRYGTTKGHSETMQDYLQGKVRK